jgi:hypothetical protein
MPIPYDYQIVEDTPKQDSALTDLAVMGVPPEYWDKFPMPGAYPTKFSPEGQVVWTNMLLSEEYATKVRHQSLDGAWHNAIQLFLDMCEEFGIAPFFNATDTAKNDFLMYAMRRHRIQLVDYLERMRLFVDPGYNFQVRKSYREYVRTEKGFIISSWSDLFPYTDRNRHELESQLMDSQKHGRDRFLRFLDGHIVHVVSRQVQVWIKSINLMRPQIGFTIELGGTVNIPGDKTPTRKEVDAFLDSRFWFPLARTHRIDGVVTRLF